MNKSKSLYFLFLFLFSSRPIFGCAITGCENLASNPSVKLTKGNRDCYLVLCSKAIIELDNHNRTIPHPCAAIGQYKIFNKVKNGKVYQDLFFQLGAENNRFAMHGFVGLARKTCLTKKSDLSWAKLPIVDEGFLPDEIVKTPFGPRKIKSLCSGDTVKCFDFDKNKWSQALIIDVKVVVKKGNLIKLKLKNKCVEVEPDQQFYSLSIKKWIAAKDLMVNDILALGIDGKKLQAFPVQEVSIFPKTVDQKTVSLSLEQHHNFVLESGIIVHNKKLWDEKTGGFINEKTSSATRGIDSSNGCVPTISGGPSPHEIILNALFEFQHYPQMLENLRREEALENEAQEAHKLVAKFQQEQESFLATKIKIAQLAAPECTRRARLFKEFQDLILNSNFPETVAAKNLDAQENFALLQKTLANNSTNREILENLESDLFLELHNSLDNAILPESVECSENGFPMDIFGSAVALSLSVILGLGSIGPMLSAINYCQSISLKLLFHRMVFAQLLFFPWPVAYKVDHLFPDQSAVVLQSLGKGFGLKSLLDTLKVASSRIVSAPALTQVATETIKVASATSLISIICPYIIPVALTAVIVKATGTACQTEIGKAVITATKDFISSLADRLVETVLSVARYFGVGPAVAGFVQTDVEKTKEVKPMTISQITPAYFKQMTEMEQQNFMAPVWEATLKSAKNRVGKLTARGRIKQAEDLQDSISVAEDSKKKYMTFEIFAQIIEQGDLLLLGSKDTGCFYPFQHNGPASIRRVIRNIPEWNMLEGDYIYFDLKHCDHFEVFFLDSTRVEIFPDKKVVARTVINFDRTQNPWKIKTATGNYRKKENDLREIDKWIDI